MINCFGYVILSPIALFFPAYYGAAFKLGAAGLIRRTRDHALASDQGRQGTISSFKRASAGRSLIFR